MYYNPLLSSASRVARILKAMSNDRRLRILCYLSERERSVGELCKLIGIGQSALSQHLAKLCGDNIVKTLSWYENLGHAARLLDVVRLYAGLDIVGEAA